MLVMLYAYDSSFDDPKTLICFHRPTWQLGIAIVNDFKSIEGDRALGLQVISISSYISYNLYVVKDISTIPISWISLMVYM